MNRFFTLLFVASSLTTVGQVPDFVPTDGLVGWWPLDGNAQDASVNEIDLIEVGDVHFESDRFGNTESVIAFNGIDGESRVEFPNFGLIDGLSQGTLSFWVNVMQHDVTGHYFGFDNMFSVRQRHGVNTQFMIALLGGTTRVRVHLDGGLPNSGDLVSEQALSIGQWHLVTITFNGAEGMQHIYIDGELDSSMASGATITSLASPDMLAFGFYGGVGSSSSNSLMDEVGLWDRALNAIEIQSLFLTAAPIEGCTEESACNFDPDATIDDGTCESSGCIDSQSCNFDAEAACDDGSCDYTCCPGPGCCDFGMHWDWELGMCQITTPSDSNFDGCVQLNDLLDLLSAYGDCGAEELGWQCGDLLEYQDYDYETVQIGEQCWFAENLRAENYRNGEALPTDLSDSEWAGTAEGAVSVYDGNMVKLSTYGRLYNWYAVDDTRALCPSSWHVSSDDDWGALELEMTNQGYAGIEGRVLKATEGWADSGNGPDTFGFSARPAGARNFQDGTFYNEGIGGDWWTSSTYHRFLLFNFDTLGQGLTNLNFGFSVRCTKD